MTGSVTGLGWSVGVSGATSTITLSGDWVARVSGVDPRAAAQILRPGVGRLAFDAGGLGHWDSALIAFLANLREAANAAGVTIDEIGLPPHARRLLALMAPSAAKAPSLPGVSLVDRTGLAVIHAFEESSEVLALVGNICLRGAAALRGHASMRTSDLIICMFNAGAAALPIVTVVNLLVGGILAFIAATELRQFGASGYVASLVGVGMVREMAALMTAIIMAGRTGGAYAANIAAMQGDEEIDALRSFGIPVFDYLILPRILAMTAMMPVLYLYGCATGVVGGMAVAGATLNVTPTSFLVATQASLSITQLGLGFCKSIAFGLAISVVACRVGLRAGRSTDDVGKAATSAVVASIVGVLALDALFDLCANLLGI